MTNLTRVFSASGKLHATFFQLSSVFFSDQIVNADMEAMSRLPCILLL